MSPIRHRSYISTAAGQAEEYGALSRRSVAFKGCKGPPSFGTRSCAPEETGTGEECYRAS